MHKFIKELLNGEKVEWRKLGEVCDYEQPLKYLVQSTEYKDIYKTPVLTAGKTFILGYIDEEFGIYKASNNPCILFDDFTTANRWIDFDFKVKSSATKILTSKDESKVLLKFIYYWLNTIDYIGEYSDHKRHWISQFALLDFPIPSLKVQKEIVDILDKFCQLKTALKTALKTERELRLKQYGYYRDKLLTFGEEVEWFELSEVIHSLRTGLNPRKFFELNTPDANNFYITIREIRNGLIIPTEKTDKINDNALKLCNNRSHLEKDDVLFSGTGTVGLTAVLKESPLNWNIKEGVYAIKPNQEKLNSYFLRHLLMSTKIKNDYLAMSSKGTMTSISMANLKTLKIPVPSLEKQKEIADILEKFDQLTNDISQGLPREIELREKQYCYYRDLLLNFSE